MIEFSKKDSPIEVGIPAESILRFLDRLDHYHVTMHSVLLMRHGKLVAEGYYAPLTRNTLHRMFSVCKTLTALAIGFLYGDDKLSLEAPIVDFFPDMVPEDVHPWIAQMTIRHMLMMRTCHASTTYKINPDEGWVRSFFTTPPTHKPDTVFHYDTSASHVLCALVERLTGMNMLDYLREKALDRLGWSKESYILKNEFGESMGGSGLMATSNDLLLLAQFLMDEGRIDGEQLLPYSYATSMTAAVTSNALTGGVISESQGYGYQVWHTRYDGFACYGMGGQLAVCLPEQDMILVTTADTQGCGGGNDLIYNSFFEEILPALDTHPLSKAEENAAANRLTERLANLAIPPLRHWNQPIMPDFFEGDFLNPHTCGPYINRRSYKLADNPQGFSEISLHLEKNRGRFCYTYQGTPAMIVFGLDKCRSGLLPFYDMSYAASAMWLGRESFYIKVHVLDTALGSIHIQLVFDLDCVTVYFRKIEETLFSEFNGHFYGE